MEINIQGNKKKQDFYHPANVVLELIFVDLR